MLSPYDWQEGIGHRAGYVEARLSAGTPVLAVSLPEGVLAVTVRRQARKLFEVYDRLMLGAVGQQSDIESLRVAAIDFAHQEGFQRSEEDVTIQRVVGALSQPLKRAFADFNQTPLVVRGLFAEVCDSPNEDRYFVLDYDGDYSVREKWAYIAGNEEVAGRIRDAMSALDPSALTLDTAVPALQQVWATVIEPDRPDFAALTANLHPETALLRRGPGIERRFRLLTGE